MCSKFYRPTHPSWGASVVSCLAVSVGTAHLTLVLALPAFRRQLCWRETVSFQGDPHRVRALVCRCLRSALLSRVERGIFTRSPSSLLRESSHRGGAPASTHCDPFGELFRWELALAALTPYLTLHIAQHTVKGVVAGVGRHVLRGHNPK